MSHNPQVLAPLIVSRPDRIAPPHRNWRAPFIRAAFRLQNLEVLRELEVIQSVERSPARLKAVHEARLEQLLHHAWSQTDYYREVLEACGAVRSGKVNLDRFEDIPFLTKDIIRSQGERLIPKSLPAGRRAHTNLSGGSISAYGSREVGAVACQCLERGGLHIATQAHLVESIGPDQRPVMEVDGELAITPLMNYAMPFIRYRIGDRGRMTRRLCACGRAFPMLEALTGRVVEVLHNRKGEQIDPIFFIWIMAEKINNKVLKKGQIVQEEDGAITVNLVLEPDATMLQAQPHLDEIREAVTLVMGAECPVKFTFLDDIPLSQSGKFPYIVRRKSLDSGCSAL